MVNLLNVTNVFRLPLYLFNNSRNISMYTYPLCFRATEVLLGEPLKKKRKMDAGLVRAREDRRRKKLEKQIRRLQKQSTEMKPIYEIDGLQQLAANKEERSRQCPTLSVEEIKGRRLLEKEWCRYKRNEWLKDLKIINSIIRSQTIALKELKAESLQLYKKAIEIDDQYLPYNTVGPVHTPPIDDYDSPDGEYIETTVKYYGET